MDTHGFCLPTKISLIAMRVMHLLATAWKTQNRNWFNTRNGSSQVTSLEVTRRPASNINWPEEKPSQKPRCLSISFWSRSCANHWKPQWLTRDSTLVSTSQPVQWGAMAGILSPPLPASQRWGLLERATCCRRRWQSRNNYRDQLQNGLVDNLWGVGEREFVARWTPNGPKIYTGKQQDNFLISLK